MKEPVSVRPRGHQEWMRVVKRTWGRKENHWEMWPGVPLIYHQSQTLRWFLPCVLVLEKGYFFCPLCHGLCLRHLAFYKNKVVASTEPLMCEFGPAPCGIVSGTRCGPVSPWSWVSKSLTSKKSCNVGMVLFPRTWLHAWQVLWVELCPPKQICQSPNSHYLKMWSYLEIVFL